MDIKKHKLSKKIESMHKVRSIWRQIWALTEKEQGEISRIRKRLSESSQEDRKYLFMLKAKLEKKYEEKRAPMCKSIWRGLNKARRVLENTRMGHKKGCGGSPKVATLFAIGRQKRAANLAQARCHENWVRKFPDAPNPEITCACGCGKVFLKYDAVNRPRKFINGHNRSFFFKEESIPCSL